MDRSSLKGSLPGGWHLRPENVSCVALGTVHSVPGLSRNRDLGITGELESRLNMDVQMLLSCLALGGLFARLR